MKISVPILAFVAALPAFAQTPAPSPWPAKTVIMVVGYPPGSGIDNVARFLAEGLRERTGQAFIIENKPGAVGNIAAQTVARAAPDGYTVLFTPNSSHGINSHMFKKLGFDPIRDFQPVTTLLSQGFVLIVNPQTVPVASVAELIAYVRARPGKLAYASGNATGRVTAEWFRQLAGLDAVHVPYKGVPQALTDLLGGQVHFMFADATLGLPTARSGKVRALAVTNLKRVATAADIPTMEEAGVQGFVVEPWFGVLLPAGASMDTARRFADLVNAAMTTDKAREFLRSLGSQPFPGTPESFAAVIATEIAKWGPIVKGAGIAPE